METDIGQSLNSNTELVNRRLKAIGDISELEYYLHTLSLLQMDMKSGMKRCRPTFSVPWLINEGITQPTMSLREGYCGRLSDYLLLEQCGPARNTCPGHPSLKLQTLVFGLRRFGDGHGGGGGEL